MNIKKENGNAIQVIIVLIVLLIIGMIGVGTVLFVLIQKGDDKKPGYAEFEKSNSIKNETENIISNSTNNETGNEADDIVPIDPNVGSIYISSDDFNSNLKGVKKYTIRKSTIAEHDVTLHEYSAIYQKDKKLYDVIIVYTQSEDGFYQGDTQIKLTFNKEVKVITDDYNFGTIVIGNGLQSLTDLKTTIDPQKFISTYNGKNYTIVDNRKNGIGTIEITESTADDLSSIVTQTVPEQTEQTEPTTQM